MFRVIALNKEINALMGIEVVKGFRRGEVAMTGKRSYTEDVILYPAPVSIPQKISPAGLFSFSAKTRNTALRAVCR
jgi:hypothetical protein